MCKMILWSYRVKIFNICVCACVSVYELAKKLIQVFCVKTQIKFLTNPICVFFQYIYILKSVFVFSTRWLFVGSLSFFIFYCSVGQYNKPVRFFILCFLIGNSGPTLGFIYGFPYGSTGKESACNAGDLGSIPGLGRSPGEGNSWPLQYSGLENSTDCIVHGVAKSRDMTERLSQAIRDVCF